MQEIIQYIRKDRHPVGVLLAIRESDGTVKIGWSKCNKLDSFNKSLGLKIALGRAKAGCHTEVPRCVQESLTEFKKRMERYFRKRID